MADRQRAPPLNPKLLEQMLTKSSVPHDYPRHLITRTLQLLRRVGQKHGRVLHVLGRIGESSNFYVGAMVKSDGVRLSANPACAMCGKVLSNFMRIAQGDVGFVKLSQEYTPQKLRGFTFILAVCPECAATVAVEEDKQ